MSTITLDIRSQNLPVGRYANVLSSGDYYPVHYGQLTGPEEAFRFKIGSIRDLVKVVKPDLVEIKTFQVL